MPFPLAHPAAVLPFVRRPFVASALVAGALAPDLLYLDPLYDLATRQIHGSFTLTLTHQFTSALWLNPLLALLALVVFHWVLKRPLVALAPPSLAGRLKPSGRRPTANYLLWAAISLVIGGFTHVLWDSFTHYDGYFVRQWGFLTANLTPTWDVNRVLQYLSSIGGILLIVLWLYRWWQRTTPEPVDPERYLSPPARYAVLAAAAVAGLAGAIVTVVRTAQEDDARVGEAVLRLSLTGLGTGAAAALAMYVVGWHVFRRRRQPVTAV
ncbi:hypothetical protein Kfla_2987 [Kribbella flavida DSM 17836]|uniref:DUF4184 domain-containing protein n=1 Tax=Kribbella flavida (strain DSM 17836 / JCM 10339 / NBRC 14399) TaxID=479435 RepID=D2Q1R3_KRIFD|nr:DUF4184 family protein [Kribbella flavida]ADB32052.1 hypothetical protein Kfla_2987 [Kribbella flavida DSM 17836]